MKTLRKDSAHLLEALAVRSQAIVSPQGAAAILQRSAHDSAVLLGQLARRGVLTRLRRGIYAVVPFGKEREFGNPFVVAHALAGKPAHFVSHLGAFAFHDLLLQPSSTVHVSIAKRRPPLEIGATKVVFVHLPSRRFWGFENAWVTTTDAVPMSDIERTLVDASWRPDLCGGIVQVAAAFWLARDRLRPGVLLRDVRRFGKKVVAKRIGFLLEAMKLAPNIAPGIRTFIGATRPYSPLDPLLPQEGRLNSRWGLLLNVTTDEIVSATRS